LTRGVVKGQPKKTEASGNSGVWAQKEKEGGVTTTWGGYKKRKERGKIETCHPSVQDFWENQQKNTTLKKGGKAGGRMGVLEKKGRVGAELGGGDPDVTGGRPLQVERKDQVPLQSCIKKRGEPGEKERNENPVSNRKTLKRVRKLSKKKTKKKNQRRSRDKGTKETVFATFRGTWGKQSEPERRTRVWKKRGVGTSLKEPSPCKGGFNPKGEGKGFARKRAPPPKKKKKETLWGLYQRGDPQQKRATAWPRNGTQGPENRVP